VSAHAGMGAFRLGNILQMAHASFSLLAQDEGHFVLSGADHPGITHKVTALLAKHRFNIERLRTSDQEAPYGGTTLFHVEGIVNVLEPMPANFNIEAIRDELAELGDSLNCDISLEDVADDELGYTVC